MVTISMSGLAITAVAQADAFARKQELRKPALTRNRSSESDRVGAGMRVLKVLVVAAEQGSANALLWQVRYTGHSAHAAPDGLAAFRVAAAWRPDVVLLDVKTPLMDGCQVAKHLRSEHVSEDCLIIAFADWGGDAGRELCMEAGIDLRLDKPVDREVVETLLMLECVRVNRRQARESVNAPTPSDVHGPSTDLHSE